MHEITIQTLLADLKAGIAVDHDELREQRARPTITIKSLSININKITGKDRLMRCLYCDSDVYVEVLSDLVEALR